MKRLLITILFLLMCQFIDAQYNYYDAIQPEDFGYKQKKNTLYFLIEPTSMGMGLRYDRVINRYWQAYTSVSSFGEYNTPEGGYIKDYVKVAAGGMITGHWFNDGAFLSCGINYHHYGESYFPYPVNDIVLAPISFELGAGAKLEWISIAFRMDILKWESSIDIGINF
jgi:hypothetical protein